MRRHRVAATVAHQFLALILLPVYLAKTADADAVTPLNSLLPSARLI